MGTGAGGAMHAVHKFMHNAPAVVLAVECLDVVLDEPPHVGILAEVLWVAR